MTISVRCTCGYTFAAADAARGRTIACIECREPIIIGAAGAPPLQRVRRRVRGVVLELDCDPRVASVAHPLLAFYESAPQLAPGLVSWFGAFPVSLRARGDRLALVSVDLGADDPVAAGTTDLSVTLATNGLLASIQDAAGIAPLEFDLSHYVLAYRGALDFEHVFLHRKRAPTEARAGVHDSGWYLGPDLTRHGLIDLDAPGVNAGLAIHAIFAARPQLVAGLGLPVGCFVEAAGQDVQRVLDAQDRVVWWPEPGAPLFRPR